MGRRMSKDRLLRGPERSAEHEVEQLRQESPGG
jgi:hypothetical protein